MKLIKKLLVFVLVLFASIVALEFGAKYIIKHNFEPGAVHTEFLFKQMDSTGKIMPNKDYVAPVRENINFQWESEEFSVGVRINSFGLREDFETTLSNIDTAFFGDSFTFGHGVEVYERYSAVYAMSLEPQKTVVSLSYKNGFQPEHYEFYFRNNPELKPKKVFVGLYLGNDLGSDLAETLYDSLSNKLELPYRRIFSGGQVGNAPSAFRFPLNYLADRSIFIELFLRVIGTTTYRPYLFRDGFEGPNSPNTIALERGDVDLLDNRALKSLARLRDLVEERDGTLTVILIPQNYYFGDDNPHIHSKLVGEISALRNGKNLLSELLTACAALKLNCMDTRPYLTRDSYFLRDGHWNAKGHREVGVALSKYAN